jgi:hypothetical protein
MAPTQKPQFQLITVMYPEIGGPRMGPNVVAAYTTVNSITITTACREHTIKTAMLLPRLLGS